MLKKIFISLFCLASFIATAQTPLNEEKVKKAVVLMQKMIADPDNMQKIYAELEELKLTKEEKKEAEKRMQQQIMGQLNMDDDMQKKVTGKTTRAEADSLKKQYEKKQTDEIQKKTGMDKEYISKRIADLDKTVPDKDVQRINALPKKILSDAEIKTLLTTFHNNTLSLVPEFDKKKGEELFNELRSRPNAIIVMGNIANALWLEGANFLSLYLMSKTCMNDGSNVNNMNNYAACLIAYGCEEIALPVLQNLNRKYPGSGTILNNIAQAWFGLGELKMASKYIDSTLVRFPKHSQANFTKSIIEEKEGKTEAAIESAKKSLEEGWSDTKLNHLKKMGYKLRRSDIKHTVPQDPMGLHKFQLPQFPKSYDQALELSPEWDKFKKSCEDEIKKIEAKMEYASKQQYDNEKGRVIIADGMYKKLHDLYSNDDDGWVRKLEKAEEEFEQTIAEIKKLEDAAGKAFEQVSEKFKDKCGEGVDCPAAEICKSTKAVHDQFINQANTLFESMVKNYVNTHRHFFENDVYLYQYSAAPRDFEIYKYQTQRKFLGLLSVIRFPWKGIMTPPDFPGACDKDKNDGLVKFKGLPDFDEMNCKNTSTLKLLFTEIVTRCNKMKTTFKVDGKLTGVATLKDVKLEVGFTEDLRNNVTILPAGIESATIEIGVKLGGKEWELGTSKDELKAGVKAEAGVIIEIDKTGITDLGVKTSVSLGGSSSGVPGTGGQGNSGNITLVGAESRWSIKAGPSLKGKSIFKDFTGIKHSVK
ncbi:MAG TPA: hypothetical protein PK977_16420 [Chitinophagaceae bacterium]|nr:hypothetical protein [Chitinophagaceae bacterium]